ncbi:MAG: phenylacetic acid degradation bifunctional protein PaaZ [Maritimibacter sp.]
MRILESFAAGSWRPADRDVRDIFSAITGKVIFGAGKSTFSSAEMLEYGKQRGGLALRNMSFHERAKMLKALALYLNERRETLYELSYDTGATLNDHRVDVDGGIGTLFVYASKGRRELPDGHIYVDGAAEQFGKTGVFQGQHVATSLQGVAVHINAFNFPVWGMLEKLAPTLLAGVPAIVKPATASVYVTEAAVRMILDSGILPEGALQFVAGSTGDLLDHLGPQDVVAFTGSADTANTLRKTENLVKNAVRFTSEQDSLNASVLAPDVEVDSETFELFIKEVHREMTVKAGQKCTAVRRIMVPKTHVDAVIAALSARLDKTTIGDPRDKSVRMGALVSAAQKQDVLAKARLIETESRLVWGDFDKVDLIGDVDPGAFMSPLLFLCDAPDDAEKIHTTEAFGPVSTILPYSDMPHALALVNKGGGSLVASVFTESPTVAREAVLSAGAWHGRLYFNNAASMAESTGHGAPMPHMIHGGPGRAGGGEELGGIRAVLHYMQRTALQGHPDLLRAITSSNIAGATPVSAPAHPFTRPFHDLQIGETITTDQRKISMDDIEHFASFTGDTFYAHMDEEAAAANPFFPGRVAHGYLLLSFAAGLFVEPNPGPVLANTGLDNLRFLKPVGAGASIYVTLTVQEKTKRTASYGEVRWQVAIRDEDEDLVATYELLTMNAYA